MLITNKENSLGFDDKWLRIIGIPLLGIIIPSIFFGKKFELENDYIIKACISTTYTFIYWHICTAIFKYGNKKYPSVKQYLKRLAFIMGWCLGIMLLLCNFMHICIEQYIFSNDFHKPSNFQINAATLFSFLLIAGIYESMRYVMLWKKTSVDYEQLQKENIQSQLEGLKNQVNPHFLFNSLNTLVNIIPENPDSAVKFVQKLSKVYRYILEIRDTKTTPLSTELDFLHAYIFLLKERFGDNLNVNISPPISPQRGDSLTEKSPLLGDIEGMHVVPLSLQILFENAIKHNIISAQRPLNIEVFVENDNLIVKNNLQRKNQIQEGTGVGLQNIKNRYQLVSNKEVVEIVTPQYFMVRLPLLKAEHFELNH